ncbi:MAG: response regulator [Nanoarchaeota archaeon]|nr:response regulator [Nanoarchaeota archaeon]MBU1703881.1 response regulator [Nanoarchaeota archaeon]
MILLIDDSGFARAMIRKRLEAAGFQDFIEADNGKKALRLFKKHNPRLVLLDIVLGPPITGLDTLRQIMELDKDAKVMIVSVMEQKNIIARAKKLGAVCFVPKSGDLNDLIKAVKVALR